MQIISGESFAEQISAWGVPCSFCDLKLAPQLVKYNFIMHNLMQLAKVKKMADNLTAWSGLATQIETNCGGFSVVQPRTQRANLNLYHFTEALEQAPKYSLPIGTDTSGNQILATLDELTHLLVAGTTGSGKSVALNDIILSLITQHTTSELAMILIDMKKVEFTPYENSPKLLTDIITDPKTAENVLNWLIDEMGKRYSALTQLGKRKNDGYFRKIVCVIDELNDLVMMNDNIKPLLVRLLQKSRAVGIHFIVATQSPRAKTLDGIVLANLPSRLALTCASYRESMLILNHGGAEKLTGKGDAIFKLPSSIKEYRVQVPFVSDEQIYECTIH